MTYAWPKAKHLGGQRAKLSGAILRPKAYRVTRAREQKSKTSTLARTPARNQTTTSSNQTLAISYQLCQQIQLNFKSNEQPFWSKDPQMDFLFDSCTCHLITSRENKQTYSLSINNQIKATSKIPKK